MLGVTLLLIFLSIMCKFLASYIKKIRTGDSNESDVTYWMFSYDFKSKNKAWSPEDKNFLKTVIAPKKKVVTIDFDEWSLDMVANIIEDINRINFRASGFPEELIDNELEEIGYEI